MAKSKYRVTDEKIKLIYRLYPITKNQRTVAKAVDLSQGTVCRILGAEKVREIIAPVSSEFFDWKDFDYSIIL
jgi:DNA-directed RNA polymerase specialized sigma subunit